MGTLYIMQRSTLRYTWQKKQNKKIPRAKKYSSKDRRITRGHQSIVTVKNFENSRKGQNVLTIEAIIIKIQRN